jgi:glycosyltransferase involved in cell wall biosynthesis
MMVRDEAHVIERALASAKPWIDHWVICDTGSTDQTPDIIQRVMAGIPGELHHTAWKNFGHNRTEVLNLAKGKADYFLIMDADMELKVEAPFQHKLYADAYEIKYDGNLDYSQWMLISASHNWHYVGVTHEYIESPDFEVKDWLPEVSLIHHEDGGMRSDKYERDIKLLHDALMTDESNSRNTFYLAQSYKDLDRWEEAIPWYEKRADMEDTWEEERWYARFQLGRMKLLAGYSWDEVRADLMKAFEMRPWRYEPLFVMVQHLREQGQYHAAYSYVAFIANGTYYPTRDILFIEKSIYDYLLLLEYGICAYATGRLSEAIRAFSGILEKTAIPQDVYDHAANGMKAAVDMLHPPAENPRDTLNRLVVVVPFRNAGSYLQKNLEQMLEQDYPNFRVIYADDGSEDGATDIIPVTDPRITLVRNEHSIGSAANVHQVIMNHCEPDDIVLMVDGDDWLAGSDVLTQVNHFYNLHDCWVMYSQFRYADGTRGFCLPFPSPRDILTQRARWHTSHLKTFRAGLYHHIEKVDPEYSCMKDEEGAWLRSATDAALMFPLIEMAGYDKVRYNDNVLYIYNQQNPNSHHHKNRETQRLNWLYVASKRPFPRIQAYQSNRVTETTTAS